MDLNNNYFFNQAHKVGKIGVYIYEIKNEKWTVTGIVEELFGIKDSYSKNFCELINIFHPNDRKGAEMLFFNAIKNGIDFNKQLRILSPINGSEIVVYMNGQVYFDNNGIPERLTGTIQDITEIIQYESRYKNLYLEFEQKQALLSSLINSVPDLIFYKDINSVYLGCNKAFKDYIGKNDEDIVGHNDYEIVDKKSAEHFRKMDVKMIQQGKPLRIEEWVKYPDGTDVLLDTLKTLYYDHKGNILGIIGISRDITEKCKKEELQKSIQEEKIKFNELREADRIKTEFFANISHELRTPINVIFSALQIQECLLKDHQHKEIFKKNYKYINMMKQNCYRLLRLISNLIDITKIDTDYLHISEVNHDIISLVENITLSVAEYIENKGISVIFDTNVEEKVIACDPEKIERIMLNLLSNAVKFTPSGGNISVKIEERSADICISVKDTGRGIPKEKLNSIFDRFVQVDKSLARTHEGSGIGLSIVKALVELHGGTISVKSTIGLGSEFILYIPCKLVENGDFINRGYESKLGESYIEKINIEFSDIYNY